MAQETNLVAYLPVQVNYGGDFVRLPVEMALELCALSEQIEYTLFDSTKITPKIELLDTKDADCQTELQPWVDTVHEVHKNRWILRGLLNAQELSDPFARNPLFIKIAGSTPIMSKAEGFIDGQGKAIKVTKEYADRYYKQVYARDFTKLLYDLVIVANITSPGTLGVKEGLLIQDGNIVNATDHMSVAQLQDAVRFAKKIGWPELKKLDVLKVWRWLSSKEGFADGFGNNSVTRALNAFTYLFDFDITSHGSALFWTMVGIEAIYATGHSALSQQIREKIQVFLGSPTAFKKKLNQMYDFRSRLVHGDLDFPGRHTLVEALEAGFTAELGEAVNLAVSILVATIQRLIEEEWNGLGFAYTVKDSSN